MSEKNPHPPKSKRVGRYTPPAEKGRITVAAPAITKAHHGSPAWYGWMLLDLLVFGVLVVALNYLQVLPGATSGWYLVIGLASIFGAFFAATKYK
jgi:pheromone shutdown protein TraB